MLSQAESESHHDWWALRTLALDATWGIEWFSISDSDRVVGSFTPAEVSLDTTPLAEAGSTQFWPAPPTRRGKRDKYDAPEGALEDEASDGASVSEATDIEHGSESEEPGLPGVDGGVAHESDPEDTL